MKLLLKIVIILSLVIAPQIKDAKALTGQRQALLLGGTKAVNPANALAAQIAAFPGIVAFWSADRGVTQSGGNMTAWTDQSINHYNLSVRSGTPTWTANSLYKGPSMVGVGTATMGASGLTLASSSYSITAFFQAPSTQAVSFGRIFGLIASGQTNDNVGAGATLYSNGPSLGYQYQLFSRGAGVGDGGGFFNSQANTPTILSFSSDGAHANLLANGGIVGSQTAISGGIGTSPNQIIVGGGHSGGTDQAWTGNLGFLIITTQPLTAPQISIINQFADAAWGTRFAGNNNLFKSLVFNDNFSSASTVDSTNNVVQGFNWYLNNFFPTTGSTPCSYFQLLQPTPAANAVVSGNKLVLSNTTGTPSYGTLISTAAWNGSSVIGNTFGGGFFIDVAISFDPTKGATGGNVTRFWPAVWLVPVPFLNNTIGSRRWTEADIFEALPVASSGDSRLSNLAVGIMTMHQEGSTPNENNAIQINIDTYLPGGFDYSQPHHYQMLWLPASKNGGTGLWVNYIDGVQIRWQTYSSGGTPLPALSPSNPVGALSASDADNFVLFIDPGTDGPPSQPVTIYSAQVYQ